MLPEVCQFAGPLQCMVQIINDQKTPQV